MANKEKSSAVIIHTGEVKFDGRDPVDGLSKKELLEKLSEAYAGIRESGQVPIGAFTQQIIIREGDYGKESEEVIVLACN